MAGCLHASTCRGVGAESVAADGWGSFLEGSLATGSPGEVDHDVSVALVHLGKGEWRHITPYL